MIFLSIYANLKLTQKKESEMWVIYKNGIVLGCADTQEAADYLCNDPTISSQKVQTFLYHPVTNPWALTAKDAVRNGINMMLLDDISRPVAMQLDADFREIENFDPFTFQIEFNKIHRRWQEAAEEYANRREPRG